jgi:hypothetical protein
VKLFQRFAIRAKKNSLRHTGNEEIMLSTLLTGALELASTETSFKLKRHNSPYKVLQACSHTPVFSIKKVQKFNDCLIHNVIRRANTLASSLVNAV